MNIKKQIVLAIDDDSLVHAILKEQINDLAHVTTHKDEGAIVDTVVDMKPDLILLDISLDGIYETVLRKADEALYKAKKYGKNIICPDCFSAIAVCGG